MRAGASISTTNRAARFRTAAARMAEESWALWQLARAGGLRPMPIHRLGEILRAIRDYGPIGRRCYRGRVRHG